MSFDAVNLHWLWRETSNRLDVYAKRVRECKDLLAAADFARYLRSSGLLNFFDVHTCGGPLEVNGATVRKQVGDLLFECGERMRTNQTEPIVALSELEAIHQRLDLIAAHVSKLSPLSTDNTVALGEAAEPELHVIEGGVNVRARTALAVLTAEPPQAASR